MKIYPLNNNHIQCIHQLNDIPFKQINEDLKNGFHRIKGLIDQLNNKEWEVSKKKMNEYEYIYT